MKSISLCLVILHLALTPLACCAESWLFLTDGRVGRGEPPVQGQATVSVRLPDGSRAEVPPSAVKALRTDEQVKTSVNAMIEDLARGLNAGAHAERFKAFRAAAAPPLLPHLASAEARYRLAALIGLQFSWVPEAEAPLLKALDDPELDVVRAAHAVLLRNVKGPALEQALVRLADHADLDRAVLGLQQAELNAPDPSLRRVTRVLTSERHRAAALPVLVRIPAPTLTPLTLPLLKDPAPTQRRAALLALTVQLACAAPERATALALLSDPDPQVRESAAAYALACAEAADVPLMAAAQAKETDPFARAVLDAALRRAATRTPATAAQRTTAASELRALLTREPYLVYERTKPPDLAAAETRNARLQDWLGVPGGASERCEDFTENVELPAPTPLTPPVRKYFDPKRNSFGLHMPSGAVPFSGSVHVGDDVAWREDGAAVLVIGSGVVRRVAYTRSWGFIVIVEHALPSGERACSLYAHLSPQLNVRPGERVAAGQLLGFLGRTYTAENGGYGAHLHFGMHRGPYFQKEGQAGWICGYISVENWKAGAHGWLDPQRALQPPAPPSPTEPKPAPLSPASP